MSRKAQRSHAEKSKGGSRVVVIGLDCLTPQLLFERWKGKLPTFSKLMDQGVWGRLESVDPPITVPAWSCMLSGYSPTQLGLYGFRHREMGSYDKRYLAFSNRVTKPRVWHHLTRAGLSSGLLGVPQTYPPKKLRGYMVSGFLAAKTSSIYTFPDPLRDEIEDLVGDYMLDVEEFRSTDKRRILADIYRMTDQRFELFRHFMDSRPTDFTMMVEIGPDRIHHAFWRFCNPDHRLYEEGNPFESVIFDYYAHLDDQLARTLERIDPGCHLFIVSDHGARSMEGGFCINDWLIDKGYLKLEQPVEETSRFDEEMVDWEKTTAWAWGGYYARIFVNLEGREPKGRVSAASYEQLLSKLTEELERQPGPDGKPMGNHVLRPSLLDANGEPAGDYPDLMLYPADLGYRAVGSVGNDGVFTFENDTGPDDANHDKHGILIYRGPDGRPGSERDDLKLVDVAPTVLEMMGIEPPADAEGSAMDLGR
jgi:predicted AlkP superfamily phosphohydrolase/phosphomutase